jgi:hypothetical protein
MIFLSTGEEEERKKLIFSFFLIFLKEKEKLEETGQKMINDIGEPFPGRSSRTRHISSAMTITFHHDWYRG